MALPHAENGEVVRLPSLIDAAQSSALVKTDQFEAIHLVIGEGAKIAPHRVSGQATLQCLRGRVRLTLEAGDVMLEEGDWTYLDRDQLHGVEAEAASAVLLTIMFG